MTSFVHVQYPAEHPGVVRTELAVEGLKKAIRGFDASRGAATVLLAAVVSGLLVVANQVIETWTEGHLLGAWVVMWVVGFAAFALLARPARRAANALRAAAKRLAARRRQVLQDEQLWRVALIDARVMADISRAMSAAAARDIKPYY